MASTKKTVHISRLLVTAITVGKLALVRNWLEEADMATHNLVDAAEQLKTGFADGIDMLKEFSVTVKEGFESAGSDIKRGVRTTKAAVDDAVKEAQHAIQKRPFTVLAAIAAGSLALGLTVGWLAGHKRRR